MKQAPGETIGLQLGSNQSKVITAAKMLLSCRDQGCRKLWAEIDGSFMNQKRAHAKITK